MGAHPMFLLSNAYAPANEAASDDVQPMLDLRLPDASPPAPAPDETLTLDLAAPPTTPQAAASSDDHHGQGQHAATGDATAPADMRHGDFADFQRAGRCRKSRPSPRCKTTPPQNRTRSTPASCSHAHRWPTAKKKTTTPAAQLHASETPAIDVSERHDRDVQGAPSPEAEPQDIAAPPDTEQEALPADALDDDAAARIAAEADATAAALENLKRLLCTGFPSPTSRTHQIRRKPDRSLRNRRRFPSIGRRSSCRLRRRP